MLRAAPDAASLEILPVFTLRNCELADRPHAELLGPLGDDARRLVLGHLLLELLLLLDQRLVLLLQAGDAERTGGERRADHEQAYQRAAEHAHDQQDERHPAAATGGCGAGSPPGVAARGRRGDRPGGGRGGAGRRGLAADGRDGALLGGAVAAARAVAAGCRVRSARCALWRGGPPGRRLGGRRGLAWARCGRCPERAWRGRGCAAVRGAGWRRGGSARGHAGGTAPAEPARAGRRPGTRSPRVRRGGAESVIRVAMSSAPSSPSRRLPDPLGGPQPGRRRPRVAASSSADGRCAPRVSRRNCGPLPAAAPAGRAGWCRPRPPASALLTARSSSEW